MARRFTMLDLVTRCKRRADKEFDEHVKPEEWKALISEIYGELHDIVAGTGLRYFESESNLVANGAASYTEPDAILSLVGIDYVVNGSTGERRPLDEIMAQECPGWAGRTGEAQVYALVDDQIHLFPKPASGTYKVRYVPQSPDLSAYADGDLVDVVCPAGEAFLIWSVACAAKDKGEVNLVFALRQRDRAGERLELWASNRSLHESRRRVTPSGDPGEILDAGDWRFR